VDYATGGFPRAGFSFTHPHADAKTYSYAHTNAYADAHTKAYADAHTKAYSDAYTNAYSYAHTKAYSYADANAYSYADANFQRPVSLERQCLDGRSQHEPRGIPSAYGSFQRQLHADN
jgi:hypothetical protein